MFAQKIENPQTNFASSQNHLIYVCKKLVGYPYLPNYAHDILFILQGRYV